MGFEIPIVVSERTDGAHGVVELEIYLESACGYVEVVFVHVVPGIDPVYEM